MKLITLLAAALISAAPAYARTHSPIGTWAVAGWGSCKEPNAVITSTWIHTPAYYDTGVRSIVKTGRGSYRIYLTGDPEPIVMDEVSASTAVMVTPWSGMHEYMLVRC